MSDEEELSTEERIQVVSKYILQAPPGEINDVVNDVRLLLDDDALFQSLLPSALKEYHHSQYTAVDVAGQSHQTIIAPAALLPVDPPKYFEPRSSQTFEFDPVKLVASSFEPLTSIPETTSTFLSTIQPLLQTYITNHFTTGTGSVFPTFVPGPPPPPPAPAPEEPIEEVIVVPIASQEEDPIIETALVETADEVGEVAKEVEEELKIEDEQEQEEREEKKAAVEDGTWEEEAEVEEGASMKGVEEPVAAAAAPLPPVEAEMAAPKEEEEEAVEAPVEVEAEAEESKEMEVEPPVVVVAEKEEEEPAAVVEPGPEPEVVEEVPAGLNVVVVDGKYTIVTSGYRYSPANFWTGRWRSSYSIDLSQSTITGSIEVVVHYYEQGNVQLRTTQTPTLTLPSSNAQPKDIVAAIGKAERAAQEGINTRLEELADKAFKSLRRALPVTRQKMEWEKVGGYKLGGAIGGKGRGEVEAQV